MPAGHPQHGTPHRLFRLFRRPENLSVQFRRRKMLSRRENESARRAGVLQPTTPGACSPLRNPRGTPSPPKRHRLRDGSTLVLITLFVQLQNTLPSPQRPHADNPRQSGQLMRSLSVEFSFPVPCLVPVSFAVSGNAAMDKLGQRHPLPLLLLSSSICVSSN